MIKNLIIENLNKSFGGKKIYNNLSFIFDVGCYVFIGKNGVGKSVLLDMIAGVESQDSGKIILNNVGINKDIAYKKHLSYVPSNPLFFPSTTGDDFLSFIYSVKNKELCSNLVYRGKLTN
ncbi:MAG: ATP-binding cassette domain-containing protein [Gammaproteobacteria bacterium]